MTPDRLRELLDQMGWSQRTLAEALQIDKRQVVRWAAGGSKVPAAVGAWLEKVAAYHARHPPPSGRVRLPTSQRETEQ